MVGASGEDLLDDESHSQVRVEEVPRGPGQLVGAGMTTLVPVDQLEPTVSTW